jgi:hypothetical protein
MKIIFSTFFTKSNRFPEGEMRYFLNGLENPSDVDHIFKVLKDKFEVQEIRKGIGVWFTCKILEKDGHKFILYWDEDLDIFFISADKSEDKWLERFLKEALPLIEEYYNHLQ